MIVGLGSGALFALSGGVVVGIAALFRTGTETAQVSRIGLVAGIGVATGILTTVVTGFSQAAWPTYGIARTWLALRHRLPWSLMDFLVDAHTRGVLRQAGAVYQFRHIELQHRFATRRSEPADVAVKKKVEEATEAPADATQPGEEGTDREAS